MLVILFVPLTLKIFLDFVLSFQSFVVPDAFFDLLADFTDTIFFCFSVVFRPCTKARILSSFSFLPCASDAAVPPGAAAHLGSMLFPSAAAVGAADASAVVFPSTSSAFASWLATATSCLFLFFCRILRIFPGSASLTFCSSSKYFCCFSMTMTMTHSDKVLTRGLILPYGLEWGSRGLIEKSLSNLQGPALSHRGLDQCL